MDWAVLIEMLPILGNMVGLGTALIVLALLIRSNEAYQEKQAQRNHELAMQAMKCCTDEQGDELG